MNIKIKEKNGEEISISFYEEDGEISVELYSQFGMSKIIITSDENKKEIIDFFCKMKSSY